MEGISKKRRIEREYCGWDELSADALSQIFNHLSLKEKLQVVPRVCKAWCKAVDCPLSWQKLDVDGWVIKNKYKKLTRMLRLVVNRSSGIFNELYVSGIDDRQLSFIAHHAKALKILSVKESMISGSMLEKVAPKLSLLTSIDLSCCEDVTTESLSAIGTNCTSLESLTWSKYRTCCPQLNLPFVPKHDNEGRSIARTMPKLKHLTLQYINIDTDVALEILSGCHELQSFNIKGSWRVCLGDGVLKEKYPKIKVVEEPGDDDDWSAWIDD